MKQYAGDYAKQGGADSSSKKQVAAEELVAADAGKA